MAEWKQIGRTRYRFGDAKVSLRKLRSGFFAWVSQMPDGEERRHGGITEAKAYVEERGIRAQMHLGQ